jgi:2,4-dienoyl-CoA reductase-like NADH-dependent reductase (Old Yellow Enzyme family)
MPHVSDPLVIRGQQIKNRIAMLPMVTFSFKGEDGNYYGEQHVAHYAAAAEGGAGLIILQSTSVVGVGRDQGMWTPGSQAALRRIAAAIRAQGATGMMQLSAGWNDERSPDAWSGAEIAALQEELRLAALRACALGFHGVEYHFAHGFTLCRFLDASRNRRTDAYGGAPENRIRLLTGILPDIRRDTPASFIVSARMGEYAPASADGVGLARLLERAGVDLLNVSFGMRMPEGPVPEGFAFSPVTCSAAVIKRNVGIPVIGLYGIRTAKQAAQLVEQGYADLVGVGRAMLADPRFPRHVLYGDPVNACLGCKRCSWFTDHTKCPARKTAQA